MISLRSIPSCFVSLVETTVRNPRAGIYELNKHYHRVKRKVERRRNSDSLGVDILDEDWDNLIILDACRYDAFAELVPNFPNIRGRLESRRSKAPYTRKFLKETFHDRELHDTVYVTAQPQLYDMKYRGERTIETDLHATVHSFLADYDFDLPVRAAYQPGNAPEHTTEWAKRAAHDFPNKRLIVHYVPPHRPFFGEKGKSFEEDIDDARWTELTKGNVSVDHEELWDAYYENLDVALEHVSDLLPELEGKTVITADHGQLLGDRAKPIPIRVYGHPGVYVEPLMKVPWFVCEYETRKQIVSEPPVETPYETLTEDDANRKTKEMLSDLGYLEN